MPIPHMTAEEFRRLGHQAIDFVADYWERVGSSEAPPVLCPLEPGETAAKLPAEAPELGEPWEAIFEDLDRVVVPGLTHWQSPNFFAYFPANGSFPAIIGDLVSTGLGVQGMLWATSPACTEVETRVMDWLAAMLGLPQSFLSTSSGGGVIHGTASEAALTALVAARHRRLAPLGSDCAIYTSTQAHSSIIKAAMVAGLATGPDDRTHVRLIGTDANYAMRPDLLESAMAADVAAGRTPLFVCATIGTTSSTAVDPVEAIGRACEKYGAWLHVDAAFSGAALLCEEHRWMSRGLDLADSFSFNPHKWMLTSFDCSCFWVRDRAALTGALSITPEYLRNAATQSGKVIDYRDWQIPLGRRFRSLKLWMVIRHYGVEGLRAYIREHVRLAEMFEKMVKSDERFEVVAPRTVSLVCFRLRARPGEAAAAMDSRNRRLLEAVNKSGKVYLTHTVLPSLDQENAAEAKFVLRLAIGGAQTLEKHVRDAFHLLSTLAE
jgi:aromatic-L-amino-acid decarboxylase